ncbi:MAG TPA: hypothetical protein VKT78_16270 [Fimbriimonadaceae bacterium]|nr:hypothetical protein [Fimbriimonadaceae bacterium]
MRLKRQDRIALTIFCFLLVAFAASVAAITNRVELGLSVLGLLFVGIPLGLALLLVLQLALVFIHELGHMACGWLVGMRLFYLRLGAFAVYLTPGQTRIRRVAPYSSLSGACGMVPRSGELRVRDLAILVAGGQIATFVLAAAILLFDRAVGLRPGLELSTISPLQALALYESFFVLALVIGSVVPMRIRGQRTDMSYLLALSRRDSAQEAVRAFTLSSWIQSGQRARDWPVELLAAVERDAKGDSEAALSKLFRYYAEWDAGNRERALELISASAAASGKRFEQEVVRRLVFYEHAYALALVRGDAVAATQELARGDAVDVGPLKAQRDRAAAAVALAEGCANEAARLAEEAITELRRTHRVIAPNVQAEIELNEELISRAAQAPA